MNAAEIIITYTVWLVFVGYLVQAFLIKPYRSRRKNAKQLDSAIEAKIKAIEAGTTVEFGIVVVDSPVIQSILTDYYVCTPIEALITQAEQKAKDEYHIERKKVPWAGPCDCVDCVAKRTPKPKTSSTTDKVTHHNFLNNSQGTWAASQRPQAWSTQRWNMYWDLGHDDRVALCKMYEMNSV